MQISSKENYTLVTPGAVTLSDAITSFNKQYNQLAQVHIVLDLSAVISFDFSVLQQEFTPIVTKHKQNDLSFVFVLTTMQEQDATDDLFISAPTLQEAEDILQMEAIARDLGF